ncbi:PREDICTED: collagen alpha-1(I) chain-like [Elephantulus edwardii]|uniref:collagen alpha-1(I) chain-like n=1 Tax=Elephantulus edwardii TaxID=28737 RepID=UPI0003F0E7CC|nr:PREDICTED: collagen alpha-1(I) chain-like [Elephantulus edwardii]
MSRGPEEVSRLTENTYRVSGAPETGAPGSRPGGSGAEAARAGRPSAGSLQEWKIGGPRGVPSPPWGAGVCARAPLPPAAPRESDGPAGGQTGSRSLEPVRPAAGGTPGVRRDPRAGVTLRPEGRPRGQKGPRGRRGAPGVRRDPSSRRGPRSRRGPAARGTSPGSEGTPRPEGPPGSGGPGARRAGAGTSRAVTAGGSRVRGAENRPPRSASGMRDPQPWSLHFVLEIFPDTGI